MGKFEQRLTRFLYSSCHEIFGTILNSIHNYFIPQIRKATEQKLDHLIFLGAHAVMQTVAEAIFNLMGLRGTHFYLEHFVDGDEPDLKFSTISDEIHEIRNIVAHSWLSKCLHQITFNYEIAEGFFFQDNGCLHINPNIYYKQFENGYRTSGPIWNYHVLVSEEKLIINKYKFLCRWLKLDKSHPIYIKTINLEKCSSSEQITRQEKHIKELVISEYELNQ
jgi:hypothetical protein